MGKMRKLSDDDLHEKVDDLDADTRDGKNAFAEYQVRAIRAQIKAQEEYTEAQKDAAKTQEESAMVQRETAQAQRKISVGLLLFSAILAVHAAVEIGLVISGK